MNPQVRPFVHRGVDQMNAHAGALVSSLRRYRLATAFFPLAAAVVGYRAWDDQASATGATHQQVSGKARKGDVSALRRPLRVNASAVGLSEHALIDQLLAART